jgi:3',5'-cyclic AMP phosphodiesterase CpdA
MTRIAHLTDIHLRGDPVRRDQLRRALDHAKSFAPDHLVLTGDLTAHGYDDQYGELFLVLHECWHGPTTIVPGNHDGSRAQAARFLDLPLIHHYPDCSILGISSQAPARARAFGAQGWVSPEDCGMIIATGGACVVSGTLLILCVHHGPQSSNWNLLDGLLSRGRLEAALNLTGCAWSVLCGHDHRVLDKGSVHTAASVAHHPDPLRVYEVGPSGLSSVYRSNTTGSHMHL